MRKEGSGAMNKITALLIIFITVTAISISAFADGSERDKVPQVAYLAPDNDTTVDLTGKNSLLFQWKNQPLPAAGRDSFRFRLFTGFDYNSIVSESLGQGVFSVEVPADKFEDGKTYSWYVQQRDASLMVWSRFIRWSFTVIKKK